MVYSTMNQQSGIRSTLKYRVLVRFSETGIVLHMLIVEAETTIVSNDKIKRGQLPEDKYNFLSSIVMRHNGNC